PQGKGAEDKLSRSVSIPSSQLIGKFGDIPVKTYKKPTVPGLQSVKIGPIEATKPDPPCLEVALNMDRLWLASFSKQLTPCPSWSGFMQVAVTGDTYEQSRIEILPFINLDPTNLSTIFTALCFAHLNVTSMDIIHAS
ncbi:MAG: hypothetical protein ABW185_09740, partial [Sedimenticola sp.]